jgi:UDP-N-acetylglucosamine 4,6-dehydratase/5-epimerase
MYVVQPEFGWWARGHWEHGTPIPDGFRYTSDVNGEWLSLGDLCAMAGEPVTA